MGKTVTFQVTNWTSMPLTYKGQANAVALTPSAPSVAANGGVFTVKSNGSAANASFALLAPNTGAVFMGMGFTTNGSNTNIVFTGPSGSLAFSDQQVYSGNTVNAKINVYQGVPVTSDTANPGYAVPLAANPYAQTNNCQDFVNSMFGPNMRSLSQITAIESTCAVPVAGPADFTGGQLNHIVKLLADGWIKGIDVGPDAPIIKFLKSYVMLTSNAALNMFVPQIIAQGGSPISYLLTGYKTLPLMQNGKWNVPAIEGFLQLLVSGAHIVSIAATPDFTNQGLAPNQNKDLYQTFLHSGLPNRTDLFNSHYQTASYRPNTSGYYYLSLAQQYAPPGCGLILALLFAATTSSGAFKTGYYNTFMQLEGWQASRSDLQGGPRHGQDFEAHKATMWNISTFGASRYCEKRGTTVFLAPPGWVPTIYQTTRMMPYVEAYATGKPGSGAPPNWLQTALVSVPPSALTLPSKYYAMGGG